MKRGSLLIEILVVVVIIALLAAAYLGLARGSKGSSVKPTPAVAMDKAHGIECANNLNQARALLQMSYAEEGQYPAQLDPNQPVNRCPVSGQPYSYDPASGRVWCTTPGHEAF